MEKQGFNLSVKLDNFKMSYNDLGAGNVPVIFIHGFPFDKTMWEEQLHFFKASHRVIAYDIRGFGASKDEKSALSLDLFADDLIRFMDQLKLSKAIICGLSMGGYIALHAYKKFPSCFEALILCDTQCTSDTAEKKKKRYQTIKKIEAEGASDFTEGFIESVFCENSLTDKTDVVSALKKIVSANSQHSLTQGLAALAERPESCSTLNDITVPTLILCGKEDELTPPAESEFMHKAIAGSTLRIIEHAGHVSNLEQKDQFNKHLEAFLTMLNDKHVDVVS